MITSLPVQMAVWPLRALGALAVDIGRQVSVVGSYRAPVFTGPRLSLPPQMIISLPVQTAV
jgi:hypothetical protein